MKEVLQTMVNKYYKQWCLTHDPFVDDFKEELEFMEPDYRFHFNNGTDEWILL